MIKGPREREKSGVGTPSSGCDACRSAEVDFHSPLGLEAVGKHRRGGTGGWSRFAGEGIFERSLDELSAVDFHRRKRPERLGEGLAGQRQSFLGCFAFDEFRRHARNGDGGLTAEGLKGRFVDDALAALFAEFDPHAQHVAAIAAAGGSHRISSTHFAEVFGIADGFVDFVLRVHSVV